MKNRSNRKFTYALFLSAGVFTCALSQINRTDSVILRHDSIVSVSPVLSYSGRATCTGAVYGNAGTPASSIIGQNTCSATQTVIIITTTVSTRCLVEINRPRKMTCFR